MLNSLIDLFFDTGIFYLDWRMAVMWAVVAILLYLAVYKEFEPLLLVPIAFGALLANLPTEGVTNKPAAPIVAPTDGVIKNVFVYEGKNVFVPRVVRQTPKNVSEIVATVANEPKEIQNAKVAAFFKNVESATAKGAEGDTFEKAKGVPELIAILSPDKIDAETDFEIAEANVKFSAQFKGKTLSLEGKDLLIWASASGTASSVNVKDGEKVVFGERLTDVSSPRSGGLYYYLQMGVLLEIFPPLIFLGVGALTDFGPLIANPKTLLLGGAAQFGVLQLL